MTSYNPLDRDSDPFRPPAVSILVGCLHCQEVYDSYRIEWRIEGSADGKRHGFWCCPIPGCDGKGFCFDIFPLDPNYEDEYGRVWVYDDEEDTDEEEDGFELPPQSERNGSKLPGHDEGLPWEADRP